jgi:hypothetical protein
MDKYSDDDWIIISDVDEMIDFTDAARKNELLNRMQHASPAVLHVKTRRYWFDFDNEYSVMYGIPMCTKKYLLETGKKLHDVREQYHAKLRMKWKRIIGFEFSSCFGIDNITGKLNTFSHTGYNYADVMQALKCNHRPVVQPYPQYVKNTKRYLFKTVRLTKKNSPLYVREHLHRLKTGNINPGYKKHRRENYPALFTVQYFLQNVSGNIKTWFKTKYKFFLIKAKLYKNE